MKRIKKGDTVIIIAGKSKGHVGKVLHLLPKKDRLKVEGGQLVKKRVKATPHLDRAGGIIEQEAFLHLSNVALYNPATKKADKVGFKFVDENGLQKKVRYFKSNNELVDVK